MDSSQKSRIVRGRGKNKRKWTMMEDDELVKALYEISLEPKWKGQGDFNNGYLSALEDILAQKLPNAGLSALPHIESRVRHSRTKFGALEQLLNRSGFTWDVTKKMLQCEKNQYDTYCKDRPDAKGLYGTRFPYYDALSAIYKNDIATAEDAEDISEAVGNMEEELAAEHGNQNYEEEDKMSRETPRRSVDSSSSSCKRRKRQGEKSKDSATSDPFLDMLHEVQGDLKGVASSVGKMAEAMGREAAIQEKAMNENPQLILREKAVAELRKLGFTGTE